MANNKIRVKLCYLDPKQAGSEIKVIGEDAVYYTVVFENEPAARQLSAALNKTFPDQSTPAKDLLVKSGDMFIDLLRSGVLTAEQAVKVSELKDGIQNLVCSD